MLNAKIVVDGRVTGIRRIADTQRVRVWVEIHTHERLWVRVWVEFCLAGMDSRTIYPRTTHPIAIPTLAYPLLYVAATTIPPHRPTAHFKAICSGSS
jgi:hypothetical protein